MLTAVLIALAVQGQEEVWIGTVYPETHPPVVRDRAELTKKFEEIEDWTTVQRNVATGRDSARRKFVEKQLSVERGASPQEVRELLGEPDRIEVPEYAQSREEEEEIWIYGSPSYSTPEYFGAVLFVDGKVWYQPRAGKKMPSSLPSESKLKEVFAALLQVDRGVRGLYAAEINPRAVLRAVNRLVALPRDEAVGAFREFYYSRWEVPDIYGTSKGHHAVTQMLLGIPSVGYQRAPILFNSIYWLGENRRYPRFPFYEFRGVPIQVSDMGTVIGIPENFIWYFDENVADYNVRTTLLKPAIEAWEVFDIVERTLDQMAEDGDRELGPAQRIWSREHLFDQCLNLLDTVLEIPHEGRWSQDEMEEFAAQANAEMREKGVRWDEKDLRYEFPNGSVLLGSDPLLESSKRDDGLVRSGF